MKRFNKFLFAAILAGSPIQSSFADDTDRTSDYGCSLDHRGYIVPNSVGLGIINGGYDQQDIVFCKGPTPSRNTCYVAEYDIDHDIGMATYTTLLTALTLGKEITFYCEGNRAKNIQLPEQ